MGSFLVLIGLTLLFLIFLIAEAILHNRKLKNIPLRITVSGTRGKTSIVRTLAAVLRVHGIRVLAKTTGSEAMYVLPDGSLEPVTRRGPATIMEQKRLIAKAVRMKADCVITEIMSIHPDNHQVETQKLIQPEITILSNFRPDHTDVAGESIREISELFIHDIFPESTVIIPCEEVNEFISNGIARKKARLLPAPEGSGKTLSLPETVSHKQMPANLGAVITLARHLNIPDQTIQMGIRETRLDIGQPEIFRLQFENRKAWFVSAFAANDPVSTRQVMAKIREILAPEITSEPEIIALLALRPDRGERSRQWLDFLKADGRTLFSRIFVSGIHSAIFNRQLTNCHRLKTNNPEFITQQIIEATQGDILVYGIANIHGLGTRMITHWRTSVYDLTTSPPTSAALTKRSINTHTT
jgi:gamma-polyglutamate synthase